MKQTNHSYFLLKAYRQLQPVIYGLVVLAFIFLSIKFFFMGNFFINLSDSMPRGVYLASECNPERGTMVSFCLAEPWQSFGLSRGYLKRGGACGLSIPLVKQVIAIPGDRVVLTENAIQVRETIYPYSTLHQDQKGRIIPAYPQGVSQSMDGYWVIGVSDRYSWDSRYFGPIPANQIRHCVRRIL